MTCALNSIRHGWRNEVRRGADWAALLSATVAHLKWAREIAGRSTVRMCG